MQLVFALIAATVAAYFCVVLCARFRNRETRSGKSISKSATSSPAVVAKVAVTAAPVESTRARERVVNCELHSQTNTHTHTPQRHALIHSASHVFTHTNIHKHTHTHTVPALYDNEKQFCIFKVFCLMVFFIFIWLICCSHTRKTHASGCTHMHMYAAITRVDGRSNSSSSDVGSVSSARPSTNAPHTLSHSIWG